MTASELRIGNWVDNAGTPRQIKDAEELLDVETFEQFGTYSPLPLTSEWLERFGFEAGYDGFYGLNIQTQDMGGIGSIRAADMWLEKSPDIPNYYTYDRHTGKDVVIRYVHQLQNLYFALEGTELTIKDDGKKEGKEQESKGAESQDKDSLE